jgi:DNA-binding GntR family transcriptional regulator
VVARLRVPRDVARGALASLEREGLLVHSLHRGLEVVRLSVDDVRDLFATRRTLELAGLEAMVRNRPADDVWLQAAVVSMTEAAKAADGRAAVAADAAFHLAIVAATSSRRLRTAAEAALRELRIVLAVADRVSSDLDDLAADHAGLLDALIHAPPPSARAALLDHLRRGESRALAVTHGA